MKKLSIVGIFFLFLTIKAYSYEIDSLQKFAWSSTSGWINHLTSDSLKIYSSHLEGYAYSQNIGWIRVGKYTEGGNHIYENNNATNYGVNNDGLGNLSGYAWSPVIGWINFAPTNKGVIIDTLTGEFNGFAYSDIIGWISFSGTADDSTKYGVQSDWRPEQIFTITYISDSGGSLIGDTVQLVTFGNHGLPVEAFPETGFVFNKWSDGRTDNPRTDSNISGNMFITAYFKEDTILIGKYIYSQRKDDFKFIAYPIPQPVECNYIDFSFTAEGNVEYSLLIYTLNGEKVLETTPRLNMGGASRDIPVCRFETDGFSTGMYFAILKTQHMQTGEKRSAALKFMIKH